MKNSLRIFLLSGTSLFLGLSGNAQVLGTDTFNIASDNAGNYGGTWINGDNEGTGLGNWSITTPANTGFFIGNPSSDGMGTTGIGTTTFGFYSTSSGYINATRTFNNGMEEGDILSFWWAMNWDANGGNKGFDLKRSDGTNVINVNNSGSAEIQVNGAQADANYGTTPMFVEVERTSTGYEFSMSSRSGGADYTTTITTSDVIDRINIYSGAQNDGSGNRNIYFNNFSIESRYTIPNGTSATTNSDESIPRLRVNSGGSLAVSENHEIDCSGDLKIDGSITLNASASGYAQLKVDGSVSGSGSVTVEQYVGTTGWHNMSMPVSGNLDAFGTVNTAVHANARNVYTWNETTSSWVDVAGATNGSSTAASAGTGYMVYVGSNGVISAAGNIDATGSLFGSTTPSLTNAGSGDDAGWNLVGNPFPCAIDFSTISEVQVDNSFSIWDPSTGEYKDWSGLLNDLGTSLIPPMQAFWVHASGISPSLGTISMSTHGTVASSPSFLKTQTIIADRLFVGVKEAGQPQVRDEILIGMVPGTSDGIDPQWDAASRLNATNVPTLMMVANGEQISHNAIDYSPNHLKTKKLQLRFVSGKQNEVYFIELHDSLLSNNYHIELEDLKLRRKHNLNNGAYKFVHDQAAEYRFVLHISPVTTINQGHTHTPVVSGGVNVGINGGMLVLKMDAPAQDVSGALLDLNGRRVMEVEYPAGAEQYELNVNGLAKGIYLLQLQSAQGEEVLKVMIP